MVEEKHMRMLSSFEYEIDEKSFKQLFQRYVPKDIADMMWEKFQSVNFSTAKLWRLDKKMGKILIKVIKDHNRFKLRVEQY